jgi:hypothetical protein
VNLQVHGDFRNAGVRLRLIHVIYLLLDNDD